MGGYQLAGELSASQEMVRYAGLVIAATLGCTITFTIPVGMGMLKKRRPPLFSRGMLIGTGTLPVTMIVGGLLSGLSFSADRTSVAPGAPLLLSADVRHLAFSGTDRARVHGICRCDPASDDDRPHRGRVLLYDRLFAAPGPCAAGGRDGGCLVYRHCTARQPSDGGAFYSGCSKAALFYWKKTGMNDSSAAGLLMGIVSPVPAITMMEKMDERGKIVNAAFLVSAASTIAAHMGFTFGTDPDFVVPLLVAKLAGGIAAVCAALFFTKKSA